MNIRILSAVVGIAGAGVAAVGGSKGIELGEETRRDLGLETGIVELRHVAESKDPVIAVPLGALVEETGSFVYLREGETDKFLKQKVEAGTRDLEYVEIVSGLFPGDMIVVNNVERIGEKKETPPVVATDKGGEKREGGFVRRSEGERVGEAAPSKETKSPAKIESVAKVESPKKSDRICPDCGKESVSSTGFCQNGYCDLPPAAPRATAYRNYGPRGYCPPSFGPGPGGCYYGGYSNCPPPSCSW